MNIGIIGAGPIGSWLASTYSKQGHRVSIANSRDRLLYKHLRRKQALNRLLWKQ
jgi:predicted dinucleotide-binding enzyme